MRHRQKTYDIVCDVVRQNGKNLYKTYDIGISYGFVRFLAISYVVHTMSYKKRTIVYDIVYDIVRQNGKNLYFDVRYRTSDVRYRILYMMKTCFVCIIIYIFLLTGPVPTLSPQASNDQDRAWNSDDERDYADQHSAPPSPMAHCSGSRDPLASFLSTVQDWSVLDKMALDNAIWGLPMPVIGPAPFGISVHDAIKVKLHDCLL
jgi:hypothetical protein